MSSRSGDIPHSLIKLEQPMRRAAFQAGADMDRKPQEQLSDVQKPEPLAGFPDSLGRGQAVQCPLSIVVRFHVLGTSVV